MSGQDVFIAKYVYRFGFVFVFFNLTLRYPRYQVCVRYAARHS